MSFDLQRVCIEIQRLDWARTLGPEIIEEFAASAEFEEVPAGRILIEAGAQQNRVYFVITGRLAGTLHDRLDKVIQRDVFGRGTVVGLITAMLEDRSHIQIEALESSTVVHCSLDELLRLAAKHQDFQLAMFRVAGGVVKRLVTIDRELPKPAVVVVVHHSPNSRQLTVRLAERLQSIGESPCLATDESLAEPESGIPRRMLFENGAFIGPDAVKRLLQEWGTRGRLFIDVAANRSAPDLDRILNYADAILWCAGPQDTAAATQTLRSLKSSSPRLYEKVCLIWILNPETANPPYVPEFASLAKRDFKVCFGDTKPEQGKLRQTGIERIVHFLRGVQIGIALGGGAARGMAHLGVLNALEQHGIFVDMLAGTSAGAMTGTVYASGMSPEYSTNCFKTDLLPSRFFRMLPAGGYWYLMYKYRFNQFGPMLRKYLSTLRMEQLTIPVTTIAVDLVDGVPLIRDTGDATNNILESINLAPLALPIVQSEQAVVDGGLLNNVPADILVAKGCNFVIASTVTAQLEKEFMGIRGKKKTGLKGFMASVRVILRQALIQSYSMNRVGVEPADFVIAPNVTAFDLSEFTRADEMAKIGEEATQETVHQLKAMLAKLDGKLFA
jgi:NTE family protein